MPVTIAHFASVCEQNSCLRPLWLQVVTEAVNLYARESDRGAKILETGSDGDSVDQTAFVVACEELRKACSSAGVLVPDLDLVTVVTFVRK